MTFNAEAWTFAGQVIQSAGYTECVSFLENTLPSEWMNGLAAHVTHQRNVAQIKDNLEMRVPRG